MPDEVLTCIVCDDPFIFTESEQRRFEQNGFDAPRRCPDCRKQKRKSNASDPSRNRRSRTPERHTRHETPW